MITRLQNVSLTIATKTSKDCTDRPTIFPATSPAFQVTVQQPMLWQEQMQQQPMQQQLMQQEQRQKFMQQQLQIVQQQVVSREPPMI